MNQEEIIITKEEEGKRLDALLAARFPEFSRTYFQKLIENRLVLLNSETVKKRVQPKEGDEVEIEFTLAPEISLKPEDIPLDILYEDDALLAINKPAGMVVHPAPGHAHATFANALLFHCRDLGDGTLRPGIVHRLDKETTGVLLAAKNERVQRALVELFSARKIEKEYLAIVIGNPKAGEMKGRIGRHPFKRKEMTLLDEGGREAVTVYKTVASDGQFSIVRLFPKTGRTHQLRVQLKAIGTPILGDSTYGSESINRKWKVQRVLLHAYRLRFPHPVSSALIEIKAPIPEDMQKWIHKLGGHTLCDY